MFKKGMIITAIAIVIVLIAGVMSTEIIKAGYSGVVYSASGGIEQDTLKQGWHLVAPWKKVTQYPVSNEILLFSAEDLEGDPGDNSIAIGSKEGKYLKVNVQLAVRADDARLPDTFTRFKGRSFTSMKNDIFKQVVKSELSKVSVEYPMFDIYSSKRGEISEKAKTKITEKLQAIGFITDGFEITGVVLDSETQKAIDALQKATMEQKQVEAVAKAEQAKAEAEVAVAKAQAEKAKAQAEVTVATAEGEAKARIAKAQGEATSNQLISNSLSPTLIQLKMKEMDLEAQKAFAEAWKNGGSVPSTFMGDTGNSAMPYLPIQIPQITK